MLGFLTRMTCTWRRAAQIDHTNVNGNAFIESECMYRLLNPDEIIAVVRSLPRGESGVQLPDPRHDEVLPVNSEVRGRILRVA